MTHPHTSFCEFFPLEGRLLTSRIVARKGVDTETPPQALLSKNGPRSDFTSSTLSRFP